MTPRADYGATSAPGGGVVERVEPGSPAARAGIAPGERIASVDGEQVRDVIDWQWLADGPSHTLEVRAAAAGVDDAAPSAPRAVTIEREGGEAWGLEFSSAIFDRVRTCRNDCAFCFMAQLPQGLRPALYLRDDDYRLSFLQGNFITLTNLNDDDIARIDEQRLSPLYVSLHAVDPQVRASLICAHEDRALERFDQLLDAGIDLHVQIVLVPGVNDAEELDRTLTWLAEREEVASVGIVPLGYTRFQERFSASYADRISAAQVIEQVQRWQFAVRERDGVTWVHLSDEFYLNASAPFPRTEWYDGYPQYENGIGIVRSFVDDVTAMRTQLESALLALPAGEESVTLVTGMLAATTLAGALDACEAVGRVRLLVVPNAYFGGNVSVAGLLAGADVATAIERDAHSGTYVIPDIMFNDDGLTVDDLTAADLRERTQADIRAVSSDAAGLLDALSVV